MRNIFWSNIFYEKKNLVGSDNPIGLNRNIYKIPFHPYFSIKDTVGFVINHNSHNLNNKGAYLDPGIKAAVEMPLALCMAPCSSNQAGGGKRKGQILMIILYPMLPRYNKCLGPLRR